MKLQQILIPFCLAMSLQVHAKNSKMIEVPRTVRCDAEVILAEKAITKKTDLSTLLNKSTRLSLGHIIAKCESYGLVEGRCVAIMRNENILFDYKYNAKFERGSILISDEITGQSAEASWSKQDIRQAQYETANVAGGMRVVSDIANGQGGILGNPKAFRLSVTCEPRF